MVIGPQPRCAVLAQERFVKFPKEGELCSAEFSVTFHAIGRQLVSPCVLTNKYGTSPLLEHDFYVIVSPPLLCVSGMCMCALAGKVEFLRPYLARLGLFPPRRNPESAPIRMEELRALVRKWNLHHKRHFWRENPTKDDVVAALNRHIKHMKLVHDHIENKKAERREADRKRQVQNSSGEGVNPQRKTTSVKKRPPLESTSDTCLYSEGVALPRLSRPSESILPSDSVETGIIYMSRWGQDNVKGDEPTNARADSKTQEIIERKSTSPQHAELKDEYSSSEGLQGSTKDTTNKLQAQQKCCLALLNMTMRDQVRAPDILLCF